MDSCVDEARWIRASDAELEQKLTVRINQIEELKMFTCSCRVAAGEEGVPFTFSDRN